MSIGQYITFDLDVWINEKHFIKEFKAKILDFCHDPLKIHPSKCSVAINNEEYGIPFNEVKNIFPADGEQLKLSI